MIGGLRFALARAKAALPQLVTLAVVAAIAGALVTGVAGAVRAAEAREVRAAVAAAPGDLGRLVVDVRGADAVGAADAVERLIDERGLGGALTVAVAEGDVVVAPDSGRISGGDLGALGALLSGFTGALERAAGTDVQVSGALDVTVDELTAAVAARRGPTSVALGLLGLVAAVVVGAVATEPVRSRADENRLLRARGARRRSLSGSAAAETAAVALAGAALGAAAGVGLTALLGAVAPDLLAAAVAAAAIAVAAAAVAAVATARGVDRGSSRARAAAGIGVAVLLAVVTAVAAWQFSRSGSPVVVRGDGVAVLDPVVVIAPALVLALAALVAVIVARPLARGIAASLSRSRRVSPVTPLRLAARRPARHALPIVVVAFAIGAITVAGAYRGSLEALGDAPEQLRVGSDVRVGTIPDDVDISAIAALRPADASMRARPLTSRGSDVRIPILAVQAPRLGAVMPDAGGAIDPGALGAALALGEVGVPLEGDALSFRIRAPAQPPVVVDGEELRFGPTPGFVRATVMGPDGTIVSEVFDNIQETGGPSCDVGAPDLRVDIALPDAGPWTLVGLDAAVNPLCAVEQSTLEVTDASSGGAALDLSGFGPVAGTPGRIEATESGLSFTPALVGDDGPWTRSVSGGIPSPMPVVVTQSIADAMGLERGDGFSLLVSSLDFAADLVVAAVIPVLPGTATGEGLLVDLATLSLAVPSEVLPNQVWFSTADPAALAAAVEAEYPQTVTVAADPQAARNAAGTSDAFLLAAGGAALLAVVVLVLRRTRSRGDARELALFAAMGLGRRRAAAQRAAEDAFAVAMGIAGGLAAGAATSWLVVPPLVRAAYGRVPAGLPVALQVDAAVLVAAVALASCVFGAIVSTVRTPSVLAPLLREDE